MRTHLAHGRWGTCMMLAWPLAHGRRGRCMMSLCHCRDTFCSSSPTRAWSSASNRQQVLARMLQSMHCDPELI